MRILLILSVAFLLTSTLLRAQNKISEGIITYSVEWQLPEQMQEMGNYSGCQF